MLHKKLQKLINGTKTTSNMLLKGSRILSTNVILPAEVPWRYSYEDAPRLKDYLQSMLQHTFGCQQIQLLKEQKDASFH